MCTVLLPPGVNPIAVNTMYQQYNILFLFHYWLLVSPSTDHHQANIYKKLKNAGAHSRKGAWSSVVVKALRYKSEGPGMDSRCRRGFFPWHLRVPCALGSTQPLKKSTRITLGVKAAGA